MEPRRRRIRGNYGHLNPKFIAELLGISTSTCKLLLYKYKKEKWKGNYPSPRELCDFIFDIRMERELNELKKYTSWLKF